jgi:flagellar basal-body rod protein FlgB
MKLFDQTLTLLERSLDIRLEQHNALASNLANADTPGYAPREVDFSAAMRAAAEDIRVNEGSNAFGGESSFAQRHASPTQPGRAQGVSAGIDGNKVDADRTLVSLAENGLQYSASARAAGKKLAILRYVASDGNA